MKTYKIDHLIDTEFNKKVELFDGIAVHLSGNIFKFESMMDWCRENCLGEWRVVIVESSGYTQGKYMFIFHEESDAAEFMLIWI